MSERISKYLTYSECTKSETAIRKGINNEPGEKELAAMVYVATNVFDALREKVGGALHATSFYRAPELNVAIGGAKNSQHTKGEAIDIDCDKFGNGNNKMIFYLVKHEMNYDQLIWEFGSDERPEWIHVSLVDEAIAGRKNRKEVLRATRTPEGTTRYLPFNLQA